MVFCIVALRNQPRPAADLNSGDANLSTLHCTLQHFAASLRVAIILLANARQ
jgi:hypothetical protein